MDRRAQRILNRNDNPSGEVAKLSDIITFKVTFWMVSVVCVAYYVAIFPFIALGKYVWSKYEQSKYFNVQKILGTFLLQNLVLLQLKQII